MTQLRGPRLPRYVEAAACAEAGRRCSGLDGPEAPSSPTRPAFLSLSGQWACPLPPESHLLGPAGQGFQPQL